MYNRHSTATTRSASDKLEQRSRWGYLIDCRIIVLLKLRLIASTSHLCAGIVLLIVAALLRRGLRAILEVQTLANFEMQFSSDILVVDMHRAVYKHQVSHSTARGRQSSASGRTVVVHGWLGGERFYLAQKRPGQ